MDNRNYELAVSNNMEYVAGICWGHKMNDMCEMKVWRVNENHMREVCEMFVYYDFGGERFAISNDGKYVVTAQYEDFKEGNLHIYEIESGKVFSEHVSLRRIQWVAFDEFHTLMLGTEENGIFFYNIFSRTFIKKIKGKKIWGDNILLLNDKKITYNGRSFKASTFAYLSASKTSAGILLAEVNGHLSYYNDEGKLYWKTDCLDLGHFINIHYDKNQNIILGVLLNSRKKENERIHFAVLNHNTGEVIFEHPIDSANYVFVDSSESVMLLNGKGIIYSFINNQLEEDVY